MYRLLFSGLLTILFSCVAFADIEKIAVHSDQGLQFYWWPKVDPGFPWKFDEQVSRQNGVKMFVPATSNFSTAETVMYAKSNYKPRMPETKTLQGFIDNDIADSKANIPNTKIEAVPDLPDGDGKSLKVFAFTPIGNQGNWEFVAFGETDEFFLIFTVSSRSQKGLESAAPAFKAMIASYKTTH